MPRSLLNERIWTVTHHGLICRTALEFKRNHPGIPYDTEDLIQEAYTRIPIIEEAYKRYTKAIASPCKYTTFMKYRLEFYFMDLTRNDRRRRVIIMESDSLPEVPVSPGAFPPAFLKLSEEAQIFVETVLDGPKGFVKYIRSTSRFLPFKFAVGNWLGYTKQKVLEIEKEVKDKFIH